MFGLTFSRNTDCDKPRRTFRKGPKCILTLTVEVIRSFFNTQEIVENTLFLAISCLTNLDEHFIQVQKVLQPLLWKL